MPRRTFRLFFPNNNGMKYFPVTDVYSQLWQGETGAEKKQVFCRESVSGEFSTCISVNTLLLIIPVALTCCKLFDLKNSSKLYLSLD